MSKLYLSLSRNYARKGKMSLFMAFCMISLLAGNAVQAQLSLTNGTPSVTIDFSGTIAGVSNGAFTAAGYQSVPTAGQLDSDGWALTGWSDGALAFAGTRTTGDYARGATAVAIPTTGGIYAYTGAPNTVPNPALLMQPVGSDFTPGTMTLKIINNGTSLINQLTVSYKIYQRNDQPRSQTIKFSYSYDDVTYTPVTAMDYATPLAADALGWVVGATPNSGALPISIPQTSVCYIRWTSDDNGGGGSRDEIGFDDIIVTGNYPGVCTPPSTNATLNSFTAISTNQMTVNFTRGNGTGGLLIAASPAVLSQNPISGINYTPNSNYGTGQVLGNGFVVYSSGTVLPAPGGVGAVTITGLTAGTAYTITLFEYDVTVPCYTVTGVSGTQSTTGSSVTLATDQFRSKTSGVWANAGTWESFTAGSWITADIAPTSASASIAIQAGHSVDINSSVNMDQVTVLGTLTLLNSGVINLNDGPGPAADIDIQGGGVLKFQTTANYTTTFIRGGAATLNVATGGKITIGNGASTPGYSPLGHTSGLVIWNSAAIYEWNTTDPFITTAVTYFPDAAAGTVPIFRVTRSPSLVPGSASATVWNGLMEVNANLTLKFAGTKTFRDGIIGTANLIQDDDCGQFIITGSSAQLGGTGSITLNNLSGVGNADIANGAIVTMTSDKVINGLNIGTLRVNSGGSLYCDAYTLTGTGHFIMQGTSTLRLGSPGGISSTGNFTGNIQTSGAARTFSATGNYIYNGTANQVTGTGLPTSVGSLTINNSGAVGNKTVSLTTNNTNTPILNLTLGLLAIGTGQQLNITTGGTVTATAGDIATGTTGGILNFPGTGTFAGNCSPYDVYASNGVNFGAGTVTIQNGGSFRINAGGFANLNGPFYAVGSTLVYNSGGAYGAGTEWATLAVSPARAAPHHVTILASGTSLNFGASGSSRTMGGNLLISSGTFFSLSSAINGDLVIGGNWTRAASGSFTNNARKVSFNGTASQTITVTGGGTETFGYMQINKTSGITLFLAAAPDATNITLNGNPASGAASNALEFFNGDLDLNQNTFNFTSWNGNQNNIQVDGNTALGQTLNRNISSTGGQGVFAVYHTNAGARTMIISRVSASVTRRALLIFGSNVKVTTGAAAGGTGGIDFGTNTTNYISTINGILQIDTRGFVTTNPPTYGNGSFLVYNTLGVYNRGTEWSALVSPGYPHHVTVQGTGTNLTLNWGTGDADRALAGNLNISNGSGLILNNSAVVFKITIGGNLNLDGSITLPATLPAFGADIWLNGNWVRSSTGVFIANERAVFFVGAGNSTITANNGELFPYLYITKSTSAQTVSLFDHISIGKILGINTGTLNLQAKDVILKSKDTTASVDKITAAQGIINYSGVGRFVVERYIPTAASVSFPTHTKSWQLLAVPVNVDGQSVNAAWQEGQLPAVIGTAGLGTIISNSTAGSGGFDVVGGVGGSMKTYVPATSTWQGIAGTNITHYNQKGYMIYIRGDRSVQTYNNPTVPVTTLRTRGKIMEPANLPPTTTVGANLFETMGNPYASAIDFSNGAGQTRTGTIQDVFYLWDPRLGGGSGNGAYQMCTKSGANYLISPGGGSYGAMNSVQNIIQSGQAFFVRAGAGGGTIVFNENAKTAGSSLVTRLANTNDGPARRLSNRMYAVSGNGLALVDGVVNEFGRTFSNEVDILDVIKLSNTGENLGINKGAVILGVERHANIQNRDTIRYSLGQLKVQQYQFEFMPENIARVGLKAFLVDKYLDTRTAISLTDTTRITFNVVNAAGSYAANRFMLVFVQKEVRQLLTLLKGENVANDIVVNWEAGDNQVTGYYEIERSADGKQFNRVHSEPVHADGSYSWTDTDPLPGINYYRIQDPVKANGATYSNTIKLAIEQADQSQSITVFPNPVTDGILNLRLQESSKGDYLLKLYSNGGQLVMERSWYHNGITGHRSVTLPTGLSNGLYKVEITDPVGKKQVRQVFISY